MAISFNKAIKQITENLKSEKFPKSKLTYWEKLGEEYTSSGHWENETLDAAKGIIEAWLKNLSAEDWESLLDSSDTGSQYSEEISAKNDTLVGGVAGELLDYILDQFDSEVTDDEIYIDDSDIDEDFLDEEFDDDDFDDFDEDIDDIKY